MVRGVSDDFWANFVDPDPNDAHRRNVTIWGQGKVNVNTANAQTILALVCGATKPPATVCTDIIEGGSRGAREHDADVHDGGAALQLASGVHLHHEATEPDRAHLEEPWFRAHHVRFGGGREEIDRDGKRLHHHRDWAREDRPT